MVDNLLEAFFKGIFGLIRFVWSLFFSGSSVSRGLQNPFVSGVTREFAETRAWYARVRQQFDASPYGKADAADGFAYEIIIEACDRAGVTPSTALGEALWAAVSELLGADNFMFGFWEVDFTTNFTLEEGVALREYLAQKERFLNDTERLTDIWREKVIRIFEGIIRYLPPSTFGEETDDDAPAPAYSVALIDLCEKPAEVVERTLMTMFDDDITNAHLFDSVRERLNRNALVASGIPPERASTTSKQVVLPTANDRLSNGELVEEYLAGTGFERMFASELPFRIPFPVRFEHTLIVGGSGHGKTQLLQSMIYRDLEDSLNDGRSIVIIDSQGDLIRTISHLSLFDPTRAKDLADRLLLIDPNDVEFPVCLNMFDWSTEGLRNYSALDREKVLNATVELYEYIFGALLGAELTQRQGVIFKYLARLMMEIPGATVHTLRQLMENGEPFRPYMEKLPGTARSFFETRFFDKTFNETKKQILTRLWGVLSNATLERMFSYPKSKVDLFEATNSGKIILINTAKELLKQEGCAIFGRFFIALISQAAIRRAALPPYERRPTFVYVDEAQDYFDQNIAQLLNQARKYRFGMVLAHQNLDQLGAGLRSSVMANTSIKFAGGVSAKDASAFASEMRTESDFVHSMAKRRDSTEFACFVRNVTPQAVRLSVPLGTVDRLPTLSPRAYDRLIEMTRSTYAAPAAEIDAIDRAFRAPKRQTPAPQAPAPRRDEEQPVAREAQPSKAPAPKPQAADEAGLFAPEPSATAEPAAPPPKAKPRPEPAPLGKGGKEHKYIQQLIKQAADERGIRAVIEEPILDGAGQVDVAISAGGRRIACEISVTTAREQELQNIEKCIAAGFDSVLIVSPNERHLSALKKFLTPHLSDADQVRVQYLAPEDVLGILDSLVPKPEERKVRGYTVKVTKRVLNEQEAKTRREAIAGVIGRTLKTRRQKG